MPLLKEPHTQKELYSNMMEAQPSPEPEKKSSHRCSSQLQASITSTEVRAWENSLLRTNSSMLHADTVEASLFSRGNHQMLWILGDEKEKILQFK